MTLVTPLRFVSGVVCLWTAARLAALLLPDMLTSPAEADPLSPAGRPMLTFAPGRGADARMPLRFAGREDATAPIARRAAAPARVVRQAYAANPPLLSPSGILSSSPAPRAPEPVASGAAGPGRSAAPASASENVAALPPAPAAPSRLSGGMYLFRRGEGGAPALASGGQLGGSQAGARFAWALGPAGPARVAAVARLAIPLDDARGAEAVAGLDYYPLPGRPLRVSIERRVDLGGAGRDAWSGYAAGGFWRPLGRGIVADGYAQAGVVGARRRDLFADGALRLGHRRELGEGRALTLGAGAWGAAQPRVARVDVGPRAAFSFPLGGTAVTAAAEWRVRVSGAARPGSGLALTLASDF